jgi:hypothetical protein
MNPSMVLSFVWRDLGVYPNPKSLYGRQYEKISIFFNKVVLGLDVSNLVDK